MNFKTPKVLEKIRSPLNSMSPTRFSKKVERESTQKLNPIRANDQIKSKNISKHIVGNVNFNKNSNIKSGNKINSPVKKNKKINYCTYMKVVAYSTFNRKFNTKTEDGKKLELIRNKIIVSDKIRDFNYILEKMTEVDVMKNLMMNEYQALCLNYLQKPRDLPTSENPQRFSTIVNSEETNISQIQSYFLRLLNEDALVGHDEYLFRGLDESIKEMIFSKLNH